MLPLFWPFTLRQGGSSPRSRACSILHGLTSFPLWFLLCTMQGDDARGEEEAATKRMENRSRETPSQWLSSKDDCDDDDDDNREGPAESTLFAWGDGFWFRRPELWDCANWGGSAGRGDEVKTSVSHPQPTITGSIEVFCISLLPY